LNNFDKVQVDEVISHCLNFSDLQEPIQPIHELLEEGRFGTGVLQVQRNRDAKHLYTAEAANAAAANSIDSRTDHVHLAEMDNSVGGPPDSLGHLLHRLQMWKWHQRVILLSIPAIVK